MRSASIRWSFLTLFFVACISHANPFSKQDNVTQEMINAHLEKEFPRVKTFKGVTATFFGPRIDINVLDQSVKLVVLVSTAKEGKMLIARTVIKGKLEYYEFDETLRLRDPYMDIDKFTVLQDTMVNSEHAIRVIKQEMAENFRHVTLIPIRTLKLDASKKVPKDITISVRKLVLHWE